MISGPFPAPVTSSVIASLLWRVAATPGGGVLRLGRCGQRRRRHPTASAVAVVAATVAALTAAGAALAVTA